jgi:F0F1-type ATP synthase membrane subunit b/b'
MSMDKILAIGGRLQKMLDDAETEAQKEISEARKKADEMINSANADANYRRGRAQKGLGIDDMITVEEKKAKKDAEKIISDYKNRMEALKNIPSEKRDETINFILKETLSK